GGEGRRGSWGGACEEHLTKAVRYVVSHDLHSRREELEAALVTRDRKIAELAGKLREVKGMLGAVLTLMGKASHETHSKGADVVELPKNFLRRTHDAA